MNMTESFWGTMLGNSEAAKDRGWGPIAVALFPRLFLEQRGDMRLGVLEHDTNNRIGGVT
jgi:hypothetical protein